jgi:hypothetical protein
MCKIVTKEDKIQHEAQLSHPERLFSRLHVSRVSQKKIHISALGLSRRKDKNKSGLLAAFFTTRAPKENKAAQ